MVKNETFRFRNQFYCPSFSPGASLSHKIEIRNPGIPCARSRERSAVSEKPAKRPRKICADLCRNPGNFATKKLHLYTVRRVNMDRFFVFLVVHDDDPATQEGKMKSTNLLEIENISPGLA